MKKIVYIYISLLSFLWACGNSYVLDTETLEDVLVDIHLAEGMLLQSSKDYTSQEDKVDLFNSVYAKYGIDKALFDSTMIYYSDDPTLLSDIYNNVHSRIQKIARNVRDGQFALSKSVRTKEEHALLIKEDISLLPFVESEFWTGEKSYKFKLNKSESFSNTIENDSVVGDVQLRFTMNSDSLSLAQCHVQLMYKKDSTEQQFDLPLNNNGMVELKWNVKEGIKQINISISALKLNANSTCELSDFRIYNTSSDKKKTELF